MGGKADSSKLQDQHDVTKLEGVKVIKKLAWKKQVVKYDLRICPSQTPMSQWTWLGLANPDVQKGIQKDLCEEKESFIGKTGKKGEIYQLLLILRTLWCSW